MSIPSPDPSWTHFTLGPITIHTYALCILVGIIVSTLWTSRRLTKRGAEPWVVLDILLWAVPLGIIGARFYHVFTHPADYFYPGADLLRTLYIWEGGNAIFGGIIGGAVGALIACRISGIRFLSFADAVAPTLLVAQAIGRLGNYVNQELFGVPTSAPWGLEVAASNPAVPEGLPADTLFQPLFAYEMVWNVLGVIVILLIERRFYTRWGRALGVYLIWYGAGRSYLESTRIDPSEYSFAMIPVNVWAAFAAVALGLVVLIVQARRHRGLEPSVYRAGREWHAPVADIDAEFLDENDDASEHDSDDTTPADAAASSSTT